MDTVGTKDGLPIPIPLDPVFASGEYKDAHLEILPPEAVNRNTYDPQSTLIDLYNQMKRQVNER